MDTTNALHVAKGAFSLAASIGTSKIIRDTLDYYSPTVTVPQQVCRFAAGVAIGGLVLDKIKESSDQQFDKNVAMIRDATEKLKSQTEPPKTTV